MEKLRMCIACRTMQDKRNLTRIVKDKEGNILLMKQVKKMVVGLMYVKMKNV